MLGTVGTLIKWIVLLPILVVAVLLAVANDHAVTVHLNPFDNADPVLRVDLALYQLGFLIFVFGALVGWLVSWLSARRRQTRLRRAGPDSWQTRPAAPPPAEAKPQPAPATPQAAAFLPRPERG